MRRLMAFGTKHVQATRAFDELRILLLNLLALGRLASEHYVHAPPRHGWWRCHRAASPGLGDDLPLPLMLLKVKHVMRDALRDGQA